MKRGVSGFVGERLRIARELRKIHSAAALADLIGLTRQVVSQYESEVSRPTEEQVRRLSGVLDVPAGFFFRTVPKLENGEPRFRSMASAVAAERKRANALMIAQIDLTQFVLEHVDLPDSKFTLLTLEGDFRNWSGSDIERAAQEVRYQLGYGSGPLPNLIRLLEHRGAIISRDELANTELDGLSSWSSGRPYIILNTTKSPARSRMDLAHEFGHVMLHREVDPWIAGDKAAFSLMEEQAFRFARALLMPEESFGSEIYLGTLDELLQLKVRWQVSIAAMIYRLVDFEMFSKSHIDSLWRKRVRNGWRVREPLENLVRLEVPGVLKSSIELMATDGNWKPSEILDAAELPVDTFLRVAGLPDDFIQQSVPSNVIQLRPSRNPK